ERRMTNDERMPDDEARISAAPFVIQISSFLRHSSSVIRHSMKTLFLTNEYPPHVYGGAGVHVDYLSRELAKLMDVEVRCFGDQKSLGTNPAVRGFELETNAYTCPKPLHSVFGAVQRCLDFNTTD